MATYKTGWIKKLVNGVSTKLFAFAHVKTVYYDYANSKTLKTKLDEMDTSISGKAASNHTHNNFVKSGSGAKAGFVPAPSTTAGTTKYLREDGTWTVPPDTKTTVDSSMSSTSTNPVQNKVVNAALDKKAPTSNPVFTGGISIGNKATTGTGSSAIGGQVSAAPMYAHAEGYGTTARGVMSHAEGINTTALDYQHACGHYNNNSSATKSSSSGTGTGTPFVIGNGTASAPSNAFRVNDNGMPYSKAGLNTTGCDYAEFFEWQDGNEKNEDRRGYFVTLDGKCIKIANDGDWILGIVSGFPSIIGNGDEEWRGRYVFDEFGCPVIEEFEYEEDVFKTITNDDGETETIIEKAKKTGTKWKEVPEYDPSQPYIERSERKEWAAIGMLGVLSVRDDGSCKENGFCKLADGGIATASDTGYRVVKRVTDNIVEVIFK